MAATLEAPTHTSQLYLQRERKKERKKKKKTFIREWLHNLFVRLKAATSAAHAARLQSYTHAARLPMGYRLRLLTPIESRPTFAPDSRTTVAPLRSCSHFIIYYISIFSTSLYFRSRSHPSKIHRQVIPGEFKVFHRHHS
mgnify:CR=1 FL=1